MKKMKKLILSVLASAISVALVYIVGAFMAWDFNPGNWDIVFRFVIGIVMVVTSIAVWAMSMDSLTDVVIDKHNQETHATN